MKSDLKSIDVKVIDSETGAAIKKALEDVVKDGTNLIQLNFIPLSEKDKDNKVKSSIPETISLVKDIHQSSAEAICKCSGELDLGCVIVAAACKFGERDSECDSMFKLYETEDTSGKKRKELEPNEKNALEILSALSLSTESKLRNLMLSRSKLTATEMKKLNLLDKADDFVDRYAEDRKKAKEERRKR